MGSRENAFRALACIFHIRWHADMIENSLLRTALSGWRSSLQCPARQRCRTLQVAHAALRNRLKRKGCDIAHICRQHSCMQSRCMQSATHVCAGAPPLNTVDVPDPSSAAQQLAIDRTRCNTCMLSISMTEEGVILHKHTAEAHA